MRLRAARAAIGELPAHRRDAVRDGRAVPDVCGRDDARAGRHGGLRRGGAGWGASFRRPAAREAPGLNHRSTVFGGVLEEECRGLMQEFFIARKALTVFSYQLPVQRAA